MSHEQYIIVKYNDLCQRHVNIACARAYKTMISLGKLTYSYNVIKISLLTRITIYHLLLCLLETICLFIASSFPLILVYRVKLPLFVLNTIRCQSFQTTRSI